MARDFPDSFAPEPIDRVAGRVLSSGTHHEFKKIENFRDVWETPPEVVPLFLVPHHIRDLFGSRKGCLVAVGYLGIHKSATGNNKKQRILVRCDCGRYEVRIAARWRKLNGINNWCQFCDQREKLKVSHLPYPERDRLENIQRARHGLPPKTRD